MLLIQVGFLSMMLPKMTDDHEVYECWVLGEKGSFAKFDTVPKVNEWLKKVLREYGEGTHINIAIHLSGEYAE